jgi:hypothetical protein
MNFLKATIASLLISFVTLSSAQAVTQSLKEPVEIPPHLTKIAFLGNQEAFEDLEVDANDMARWANQTDKAFLKVFGEELGTVKENAKLVGVIVALNAIKQPEAVCKKDYTKCVLMTINIQFSDNIPKEQIKEFNEEFSKIKEIKIGNFKSKEKVGIAVILGTQENITNKQEENCNAPILI